MWEIEVRENYFWKSLIYITINKKIYILLLAILKTEFFALIFSKRPILNIELNDRLVNFLAGIKLM